MKVNEALTHDGAWQLTGSGFEGDDARLSYSELYQDGQGNRVAVVISPEEPAKRRTRCDDAPILLDACDGEVRTSAAMSDVIRKAVEARLRAKGIEPLTKTQWGTVAQNNTSVGFVNAAFADGKIIKNMRVSNTQLQIRV